MADEQPPQPPQQTANASRPAPQRRPFPENRVIKEGTEGTPTKK
jgi:hypothetical protein